MELNWRWLIGLPMFGVLVGKIVEIPIGSFLERKKAIQDKAKQLLQLIKEYAILMEMYKFFATEEGKGHYDENGKWIHERLFFKVEDRYSKSFERVFKIPIQDAIADKIVSIRLNWPEELNLAKDLDTTGTLEEKLVELQIKVGIKIEIELNSQQPALDRLLETIREADAFYASLRSELQKYAYITNYEYLEWRIKKSLSKWL